MSYQIFSKYGGAGLSSVKSTCEGYGIIYAAAGDGSAADVAGDGSVVAATGYGSAVVRTGVYDGLGTGSDGALRL